MASQGESESSEGDVENQFEAAAQRVRELNEQIIQAAWSAGQTAFGAYESWLRRIAEEQEKARPGQGSEWFSTLLKAQADFTHQLGESYRELMNPRP